MVIAFCTSAMNRRWQLRYTLAENLQWLRRTRHFLALCDFNSGDDLPSLIHAHAGDIRAGRLLYFRTEEPDHFHSSMAKNLAHRLALSRRPDVLFNLDADNYLDGETIGLVTRTFQADPRACLHHWTTCNGDGTFGRIALAATAWKTLGGYDEALYGASWQDVDLLFRSRAAGLTYVHRSEGIRRPIPNSMEEKTANLAPGSELDSRSPSALYFDLQRRNVTISMGRPLRFSLTDQRRFQGVKNFTIHQTI